MSAMEVLETVAENNIPHKHPLTAMIWTNEEGSLYPPAMMCSGIVCYDYLPEDIRVLSIEEVPLRFHSRYHAVKKTYRYTIWNAPKADVFLRKWVEVIPEELDLRILRRCGRLRSCSLGRMTFSRSAETGR